jgi:hypothetical protein
MTYWTWITAQGEFRTVEIGPIRINLLSGKSVIGSYPTPPEAADCRGEGHHVQISEGFDGGRLRVSRSLPDSIKTHAIDNDLQDDLVGVLAELRRLPSRGTLPGPRNS